MVGKHCIKTWSATQGAFAVSSGEAEFYAMVEAVLRAKGLISLMREVGFENVGSVVNVATDSNAAKSFVSRRGLGKMRHIEVKDLWIQSEVAKGKIKVNKVWGEWNPADLMTKVFSKREIDERLKMMAMKAEWL